MDLNNDSDGYEASDSSTPLATLSTSENSQTISVQSNSQTPTGDEDIPNNPHRARTQSLVFPEEAHDPPPPRLSEPQQAGVTISEAESGFSAAGQGQDLQVENDHLSTPLEDSLDVTPRAKFRQKLDLLPSLPLARQRKLRDELAADYCTLVGKHEALDEQLRAKRMRPGL